MYFLRFRTPLSRAYHLMSRSTASGVISTSASLRPHASFAYHRASISKTSFEHEERKTHLRTEILLCNLTLLLADVSADFENLHAVEERGGDGVEGVGGANKEDAGEVDGEIEAIRRALSLENKREREWERIKARRQENHKKGSKGDDEGPKTKNEHALMIQEAPVLLRVQHLEQRTRRISIVSPPNLVNLIDQHQWVLRLDTLEGLDDLSWQSSIQRAIESASQIIKCKERDTRTQHKSSYVP
jgi:hypothetical protein